MGHCYSLIKQYFTTKPLEAKAVEPSAPEMPIVDLNNAPNTDVAAQTEPNQKLNLNIPTKKYSVVSTLSCDGYYSIGVTDKSLDHYMRELELVKARVTWTTLHMPESGSLVSSFETLKEAKENEYFITLEFMCLYGIHKVRGSKFNNCVLSFEEIEQINSELSYFYNKCSICDEFGHDAENCIGSEFN